MTTATDELRDRVRAETYREITDDIRRRGFPRLADLLLVANECPHDRFADVTGFNSVDLELVCIRCGFPKSAPRRELAETAYDEYEREITAVRVAGRQPFDWAFLGAGCPRCKAVITDRRGMRWNALAVWCLGCGWSSNWPVPQ